MTKNPLKDRVATKLAFHWYGNYRKIEASHHRQMSDAVEAQPEWIRTAKALYNSKISAIKNINQLKGEIKEYWENNTTPHPDQGVRLLLKADVETFNARIANYSDSLFHLAQDVEASRDEILSDAQTRLGKLFNEHNYPSDLATHFSIELSYPSLEPPKDLPKNVYQEQKALAYAKLQEAIQMAEAAFTAEFTKLIDNLKERLTPDPTGEKKVFKDATLTNLVEFFDRFKKLNLSDNDELTKVIDDAKQLVTGLTPTELRNLPALRNNIAAELSKIGDKLMPLIGSAPRRKILTPKEPSCSSTTTPPTANSTNAAQANKPLPSPSLSTPLPAQSALFASTP